MQPTGAGTNEWGKWKERDFIYDNQGHGKIISIQYVSSNFCELACPFL